MLRKNILYNNLKNKLIQTPDKFRVRWWILLPLISKWSHSLLFSVPPFSVLSFWGSFKRYALAFDREKSITLILSIISKLADSVI